MDKYVLKSARLITPAVMFAVGAWLVGKLTGLWTISLPTDAEAPGKSIWMLVIGALYYMAPFREISNKPFYEKVNENVRAGLVRVAGVADLPHVYTWKNISGIFYSIVDNDPSLKVKASFAYFNGYFWTSVADCRAVATIFFLFSLGIAAAGGDNAVVVSAIFAIVALATYPASYALTKKHMEIASEQIEIFQQKYEAELKAKFDAVRIRVLGPSS